MFSYCYLVIRSLTISMYFEYFRLDYQAMPHVRGASAFRNLVAKLPPRAHSIYYRDEIGNISTSNIYGDSTKVRFFCYAKSIIVDLLLFFYLSFLFTSIALIVRHFWKSSLDTQCLVVGELLSPLDSVCHFRTTCFSQKENVFLISLLVAQ